MKKIYKIKDEVTTLDVVTIVNGIFNNLDTESYRYESQRPIIAFALMLLFIEDEELLDYLKSGEENVIYPAYDIYLKDEIEGQIRDNYDGDREKEYNLKIEYIEDLCNKRFLEGMDEKQKLDSALKIAEYYKLSFLDTLDQKVELLIEKIGKNSSIVKSLASRTLEDKLLLLVDIIKKG